MSRTPACSRRLAMRGLVGAGAAAGAALAAPWAMAQQRFTEGVHYAKLAQPIPPPPGRFEVVEFFWYECPHCHAFEPVLEAWEQQPRPDVQLRRVPVYFSEVPFAAQQRLFHALEASGQLKALHRKVFHAIHVERKRLRSPEEFRAFVAANGGNADAFMAAYASPLTLAQAELSRRLASAYGVDGVPSLGVQGRWLVTGAMANAGSRDGSNARMLEVVDTLLVSLREGR